MAQFADIGYLSTAREGIYMTKREYMKKYVAEKTGYTKPMNDHDLAERFCDLYNDNWFDTSCRHNGCECPFIEDCVPVANGLRTVWMNEEYDG